MASWDSIAKEIQNLKRPDANDVVRRAKMAQVSKITGRDLLLYAVDMSSSNPLKGQLVGPSQMISLQDKDGFDEITRNLTSKNVDILLHSPGGSAEATESIVELLRARFSDIRFIVPSTAKSAATMMAMSGNQILMDERSELGPIDPQMIMPPNNTRGAFVAPAQAILDQFEIAQKEVNADTSKLPSWVPILSMYGPSLLAQCQHHLKLAEDLVSKWLQTYMFAGQEDAETKALKVAHFLNDHGYFHSHNRRVGIEDLKQLGINIFDLRTDPALHSAVRDLYSALSLTFENTMAYKIFENSKSEAYIQQLIVQQNAPIVSPTPSPGAQLGERIGKYGQKKH